MAVLTSTFVPPQLLETNPSGTSLPAAESWVESSFPKSQQTAENVEKSVWPGRRREFCHSADTPLCL